MLAIRAKSHLWLQIQISGWVGSRVSAQLVGEMRASAKPGAGAPAPTAAAPPGHETPAQGLIPPLRVGRAGETHSSTAPSHPHRLCVPQVLAQLCLGRLKEGAPLKPAWVSQHPPFLPCLAPAAGSQPTWHKPWHSGERFGHQAQHHLTLAWREDTMILSPLTLEQECLELVLVPWLSGVTTQGSPKLGSHQHILTSVLPPPPQPKGAPPGSDVPRSL